MISKVMDWIKKITDIIMPLEPIAEEEEEEPKKAEEKVSAAQPVAKKVATGGGTMSYTSSSIVNTSDSGSMSMDGMRYTAYSDVAATPTARPSLTVVKPHELTVKIYAPENFDQVVGIADDILGKKAAVVNYERVAESDQRKICDFVNGVCYATDGSVNMISDRIFLYMPPGVESGEIARIATSVRIR
ncbi:MAG: cell division protein SepF [Selenomonadaceae bacterium]|nr:cell division protein SepF [Selenomonadaceae bacterium]